MSQHERPDRVEREKINGKTAKVRLFYDDPDNECRFEVERVDDWTFGVDEAGVATLVDSSRPLDAEIPEWVVETLYGIGISEITR